MKVKVCYKDEIHRVSKVPDNFQAFMQLVSSIFHTPLPQNWTLQYKDSDGDDILLNDEKDFEEFRNSEGQGANNVPKVYVVSTDSFRQGQSGFEEMNLSKASKASKASNKKQDEDYQVIESEERKIEEIPQPEEKQPVIQEKVVSDIERIVEAPAQLPKEEEIFQPQEVKETEKPQEEEPKAQEVQEVKKESKLVEDTPEAQEIRKPQEVQEPQEPVVNKEVAEEPVIHKEYEVKEPEVQEPEVRESELKEPEVRESELVVPEIKEPEVHEKVEEMVVIPKKKEEVREPEEEKKEDKIEYLLDRMNDESQLIHDMEEKINIPVEMKGDKAVVDLEGLGKLISSMISSHVPRAIKKHLDESMSLNQSIMLESRNNLLDRSGLLERNNLLDDDSMKASVSKVVHYGITCSGCKMNPIVGVRYKCTTCPNFDYCERCEDAGQHPHNFIKMRQRDLLDVFKAKPQGGNNNKAPVPVPDNKNKNERPKSPKKNDPSDSNKILQAIDEKVKKLQKCFPKADYDLLSIYVSNAPPDMTIEELVENYRL